MTRRILLLGGHGVVGSRITRLLTATPGFTFLIAGRDKPAVGLFVEYLLEEGIDAVAIASSDHPAAIVAAQRPALVIDATGRSWPDHALARACIAARVPYLDISDDRSAVLGIRALDTAAKAAGVAVVSGAGVVPCLSMAAVASLAAGLAEVGGARVVVRRGNREEYGPAAIASMLGHAGTLFRWRRHGESEPAYAFDTALPPEDDRFGTFRLLAYDTPDLDLLVEQWPALRDVTVWAGVELRLLSWGMQMIARLNRLRPGSGLASRLGLFDTLARSFAHFGTARSVLRVWLEGRVGGNAVMLSWTLAAVGDSGAWLRAAPAVAVARQILQGVVPPGASVARLDLAEILVELKGQNIQVNTTDINQ